MYESDVKSANLAFAWSRKGKELLFKLSMRNKYLIEEHVLEGLRVREIRHSVTNSNFFSKTMNAFTYGKMDLFYEQYAN